jgi:hypothetical protein
MQNMGVNNMGEPGVVDFDTHVLAIGHTCECVAHKT